jgi:hypothetical protein
MEVAVNEQAHVYFSMEKGMSYEFKPSINPIINPNRVPRQ